MSKSMIHIATILQIVLVAGIKRFVVLFANCFALNTSSFHQNAILWVLCPVNERNYLYRNMVTNKHCENCTIPIPLYMKPNPHFFTPGSPH